MKKILINTFFLIFNFWANAQKNNNNLSDTTIIKNIFFSDTHFIKQYNPNYKYIYIISQKKFIYIKDIYLITPNLFFDLFSDFIENIKEEFYNNLNNNFFKKNKKILKKITCLKNNKKKITCDTNQIYKITKDAIFSENIKLNIYDTNKIFLTLYSFNKYKKMIYGVYNSNFFLIYYSSFKNKILFNYFSKNSITTYD